VEKHEQAWAEALAQEHAHQRELLATLRDELGTFARECAAALTALDSFVGLAGIASVLSAAGTDVKQASLVLEVGRRLPALGRTAAPDPQDAELYDTLGGEGDVPPPLVRHAGELLRAGPKRSDRELLQAVVSASGARSQLEAIIGPAPAAALSALKPLAHWAPLLARVRSGDARGRELAESIGRDLSQVLQSAAQLGAGADTAIAGEAASLADSLRDTVQHVEAAARSVKDGKLEQAIAEARKKLEDDLEKLRGVHEGAHDAPHEWREARRAEHAALTEEVREKLEKSERIRRVLGFLLPHLQAISRALTAVQKLQALAHRLEPPAAATVEASRMSLLLELGALWDGVFEHTPHVRARRSSQRQRWIAAALAAVLVAAVLAVVLSSGGKKKGIPPLPAVSTPTVTAAPTTTAAAPKPPPVPKAPKLSPVKAVFSEAQRATFYTISVVAPGQKATYAWRLSPPKDNPTCTKFHQVAGKPNESVWHHASTDGCTHNGIQHLGTVYVTVTTKAWRCTASFFGTLTQTGASNQRCTRRL
jgi:hypothetical protein